MFKNLQKEMKEQHISNRDLARAIGKDERSISNKLSGRTDFTRIEMFTIRDTFFPEMTLEYLFL
nr:MAG TPA: Regulatory protein [Caudoviricetes sp.]